jgi:hypothetical protein
MELHLKLLIILPEEAYAIYTSTPKLMSPTDVKTLTSFGEPFPAKACSMTTSPGIPLAADSAHHTPLPISVVNHSPATAFHTFIDQIQCAVF